MDRAACLDSITSGMSSVLLVLSVVVLLSGCVLLKPVDPVPKNLIEEDLVGQWGSRSAITISDLETKTKYQDARLIVTLNPDHTYEESVVQNNQTEVFRSTWQADFQDAGRPVVKIKDWRYLPEETLRKTVSRSAEYDVLFLGGELSLCYPTVENDGNCLDKGYVY